MDGRPRGCADTAGEAGGRCADCQRRSHGRRVKWSGDPLLSRTRPNRPARKVRQIRSSNRGPGQHRAARGRHPVGSDSASPVCVLDRAHVKQAVGDVVVLAGSEDDQQIPRRAVSAQPHHLAARVVPVTQGPEEAGAANHQHPGPAPTHVRMTESGRTRPLFRPRSPPPR